MKKRYRVIFEDGNPYYYSIRKSTTGFVYAVYIYGKNLNRPINDICSTIFSIPKKYTKNEKTAINKTACTS